ncbi:hypothetical protein Bca52824_028893 [Brassica carinata]|uniref:Uncharacterized protein n=1 Tax=Brassica carinata TaxID=52824 RepID=A0A8X8ANT4_BRACI|nr:hypothetical protein Bca52824_028893 [Brassica carinata]
MVEELGSLCYGDESKVAKRSCLTFLKLAKKSRRIWIETMERAKMDADAFSEKVFSKKANSYGR